MFGSGGGRGGGGGGDPEAFRERPGESRGSGGGFDFGRMRTLADLVNPGRGLGGLFRSGGGQAPLADAGEYIVRMEVDGRAFTRTLDVLRSGDLSGDDSPFEAEWARFLKEVERAR